MSQISDWIQTYWYELGSLLIQCGILATLVWYGRRAVRTVRSSQRQMETLLSLNLAPGAPAAGPAAAEHAEGSPHRAIDPLRPLRSTMSWLQAPVGSGGGIHPWRRIARWLQAPAGS